MKPYRKLSLYEKIGLWGSLASLFGIALSFVFSSSTDFQGNKTQSVEGNKNVQIQGETNIITYNNIANNSEDLIPEIPDSLLLQKKKRNIYKRKMKTFRADITDNKFLFGNTGKTFLKKLDKRFWSDYFFVVSNIHKYLDCVDGLPESGEQLIEINGKNAADILKSIGKYRFPFYDRSPTTLGFLANLTGASGGSTQKLYLIDTESSKHVVITMFNCNFPIWLDTASFPPKYARTTSSYIGPHVTSLGLSHDRVSEIYVFNNNEYIRSSKIEKNWFNKLYKQSILSEEELKSIQGKNLNYFLDHSFSEEYTNTLKKLLDNIHYARKSNHIFEVMDTIKTLDKSMQRELEELLGESII